jgi:uncharacterized protein (TIGR03067 family)
MAVGLVAGGSLVPLRGSSDKEGPSAEQVVQLIRQLGDDDFRKREAASTELTALGEPALAALKKAATSDDDPEIRRRAEGIIQTITGRLAGAELKRLEGNWVGVAHEENGKEAPCRTKVVLAEGCSVATDPAGVEVFRCNWRVIDPTAVPRQLDLVGPDGRVFQAIYEFDGAKLRYCGSYTKRPDRFSTKPGDGRYMATLKREPK